MVPNHFTPSVGASTGNRPAQGARCADRSPWLRIRAMTRATIPEAIRAEFGILPEDEAWALLAPHASPLPPGWAVVDTNTAGLRVVCKRTRQLVILTVRREADGKRWLHLSTSFPGRMPSYTELADAKRLFIGDERAALQVFARKSEHINIAPNVLHLWHCFDGDPLPDFRVAGAII